MTAKTNTSVGAVPPRLLVLQYNKDGSITLFNEDSGTWLGVFTCESHAIKFARRVIGYEGDL